MIEWIKETAGSLVSGYMGLLLYFVPMAFCAIFYTIRTSENYRKDRIQRENGDEAYSTISVYHPTDTIGTLVGRAVVSVVPVANIWAAMFDLAPNVFGKFFEWLDNVFNQPLVPDTEAHKAKREAVKNAARKP